MRRSQLAPSVVGEKGGDHGPRLHHPGKHNRNGSNDATDSHHRAKHFVIGIIVMCLSLFTCFHFFISAAVNRRSFFSTIGSKDEDDNNEILPICWGKNNDIATTRWNSALIKISRNTLVIHSENRSVIDFNHGRKSITGGIPKIIRAYNGSIRSDSRYFYDVSSLYPLSNVNSNNNGDNKDFNNNYDYNANDRSNSINKINHTHYDRIKNNSNYFSGHTQDFNNNYDYNANDRSNSINKINRTHYDRIKNNSNYFSGHTQDQTLKYCQSINPNAGVCVKESSTLGFRCLPSFLIIGTMKSGTGELMAWLNRHPNLQSG